MDTVAVSRIKRCARALGPTRPEGYFQTEQNTKRSLSSARSAILEIETLGYSVMQHRRQRVRGGIKVRRPGKADPVIYQNESLTLKSDTHQSIDTYTVSVVHLRKLSVLKLG